MSSMYSGVPKCKILLGTKSLFSKVHKFQKVKVLILCVPLFIVYWYFFENNNEISTHIRLVKLERFNNVISHSGGAPSKILCYILLSEKLLTAAKVIQETWGNNCDKLIFFGHFQSHDIPVTFLNVPEGYAQLWGKTKAALIHLQKFADDYEWFIKADSDTYVIMNNLRRFVADRNPNFPTWFGYKLKNNKLKRGYMSGGAGYTFSREALKKIGTLLKSSSTENNTDKQLQQKCGIKGNRGYEDLELGKCFSHAGVIDISTLDNEGKERFLPLPLNTLLSGDLSNFHWIWQKAWNHPRIGPNCCSSELISMHQISPAGMQILHFLLDRIKH